MTQQNLSLRPGQHVCHFYESFDDQKRIALAFIKEGLENGEYCVYVTSDQSVDDWYLELQSFGVDVARLRRRGALDVIDYRGFRTGEDFNSIRKAREVLTLAQEKLIEFAGVRITGDCGWEKEPPLPQNQLTHWEATGDLAFSGEDIIAICQYDVGRCAPQTIRAALRTHSIAVLNGVARQNPYYEAPTILEREPELNNSDADAATVREMLSTLASAPLLQ